jgi:hypothetical protein
LKAGEVEAVLRPIETTFDTKLMFVFIAFLGEKGFELEEGRGAFQGMNMIIVVFVISRWSNKLSPYQKGFKINILDQRYLYFMVLKDNKSDSGFAARS